MWQLCITISGRRYCFPVPLLVEKIHLPGQGPINYPQLELAIAVIDLANAVRPLSDSPEFTNELVAISTRFIEGVRKGLPAGVELKQPNEAETLT